VRPSYLAVLLTPLVGTSATAQSRALHCEAGIRRIELTTASTSEVPELCISPELSTTLLFEGAELLPDSVNLDGRERFKRVDPASTVLRLTPSERMVPGERFRLTVRFRDGAAPSSAAFWLVVSPGQVSPLVEVYRESRTVESYQQEAKEKDTQLRQCQQDTERLRAEKEGPGGLAGLLALGLLGHKGISSKDIVKSIEEHPSNVARILQAYSYRSARTVAVDLVLLPAQGTKSWSAVRAELVGPRGRTLRVKPPWQQEPIQFAVENWHVVVEAETTEEEAQGSFTLRLWNEDGTRSVIVSGITFP